MGGDIAVDRHMHDRPGRAARMLWVVAAVLTVAMGALVLSVWSSGFGSWWGIDGARNLEVARIWLNGGDPYSVTGFLYAPLAFILTAPWTLVREDVALTGWFVLRLLVVIGSTWYATRGMPPAVRALATVVVSACVPVLSEFVLGNVTIPIAAAMLPILYRRDRLSGIPFAVVFAAAPKPLLIPFLLWVLVHRRKMVAPMVISGLAVTAIATAIAGPNRLYGFLRVMADGGRISLSFAGNDGLTAYAPGWLIITAGVVAAALASYALWRADEATAAVVVTLAGLFLTPYVGANLPIIVLPPLSLYARCHPLRGSIVAAACALIPFNLPLFAGFALVAGSLPHAKRDPTAREAPATWL
jgi:hypothetical protein